MSEAAVPLQTRRAAGIAAHLAILAGGVLGTPALAGLLVVGWAGWTKTWRDFGFVRPKSWAGSLLLGAGAGILFKLLLKSVVMPLLGAPPVNAAYHWLAGNTSALPAILAAVVIGAGFGEEAFFRSWMFERLRRLRLPALAIVLLTSALFAAAHYQGQGLPGVEQAAITGLAFGTAYALSGRIFTVMVAHAFFDIAAVAIIYFDAEPAFAHAFF